VPARNMPGRLGDLLSQRFEKASALPYRLPARRASSPTEWLAWPCRVPNILRQLGRVTESTSALRTPVQTNYRSSHKRSRIRRLSTRLSVHFGARYRRFTGVPVDTRPLRETDPLRSFRSD